MKTNTPVFPVILVAFVYATFSLLIVKNQNYKLFKINRNESLSEIQREYHDPIYLDVDDHKHDLVSNSSAQLVSQTLLQQTTKISETYTNKIKAHLSQLDFSGKHELLNTILEENMHALLKINDGNTHQAYYHQYCITFAKKELAALGSIPSVH